MKRVRWLAAGLVITVASALAVAEEDQAILDRALLTRVRPMAATSILVETGAAQARIVAPMTAPWLDAARRIQTGVETTTGVRLPVIPAAEFKEDDWGQGNLIVIGNLLTSPTYARLYHNFFVCADAGFTGRGGYELRTVHEPFGPGTNVIALGAQDGTGLTAGTDRLLKWIGELGCKNQLALPRLLELDLQRNGARPPVPQPLSASDIADGKAFHDRVYARVGTERAAAHRLVRDAMSYHRTGDDGYLELYRYGIMSHINYYRENEYINSGGLGRYDRDFRDSWTWKFVVAWDLLEEHPGWSDEERLMITNHLLRCILECNIYQNWMGQKKVDAWRNFDSITHNHHTWPGLANLFGGWYFKRHYQHPLADDWLTIALGMFNGCKHSSKPWEDAAGYQWIPIRHVLTYSYASGDMTFVEEGHADLTGQVALMCLDSLGNQPAFGDYSSFTSASGISEVLSLLEYATRDGRYRWALDRLNATSGGELEEPYYTEVKPKQPDDLIGVTASYLPRPHYELNGRNRQYFPRANVSPQETFDKLTLRAGWDPNDDYLMLDGYSGGSHGHQDCNAIIGYTGVGKHWLVDGEYIRQTPKYHCAVTVVRDGTAVRNPAMASLDDAVWFGDAAICRTTIPDYNGVRWMRHLFWLPNQFTVAIDELTALKPGDYSLRCCWRVYGETTQDGNDLHLRQDGARFLLRNLSADHLELVHIKDVSNLPVHHLYQRRAQKLDTNDRVCFVNVFAASADDEVPFEASLSGERRATIHAGGKTWVAGVGSSTSPDARISAQAWLAQADTLRLATATGCSVGNQDIWQSDEPCAVRISGATVNVATPRATSSAERRPVLIVDSGRTSKLDSPLKLDLKRLGAPAKPKPFATATALSSAIPLNLSWRFDDFPRTPKPLQATVFRTDPEPRSGYRPAERLVDGHYSSSTASCLFPAGKRATVDLELTEECAIQEVRIRAWEMSKSWQTKSRNLLVSTDGESWRPVPGKLEIVGTQRWGGNINTIYAQSVPSDARFVRVSAEPASEKCGVYFAEIEVIGSEPGERPDLTTITHADLDGDGNVETVVGSGGGHIIALDASGQQRWRANIGAPITALAICAPNKTGSPSIVYGASSDLLGLISSEGEKVQEIHIPQYRGIASEPRNISIADLDGDGVPSIVVGARSWQYLAYSPQLELEWKNVIYAHSATVADVADLDGDGMLETVGGNAYFCMNIINSDGSRRISAGRFGPEQTAVASIDLSGDGVREVVFGTDGGDVLVFDLGGKKLWERNVGDRVTSLVPTALQGRNCLLIASESGHVWALDFEGKPIWCTSLGEPVRRLIPSGDHFVCAASGAGLAVLSRLGKVIQVAATPAPVKDVIAGDRNYTALLADGSVCGFAAD